MVSRQTKNTSFMLGEIGSEVEVLILKKGVYFKT